MPSRYTVRYLPAAAQDLLSVHDWIVNDNPERAASFVQELDKKLGKLASHPHLGRVPKHTRLRESGYRVLIVAGYLAFYKVRGRTVQIHRVIYGSRHLDSII